MTDPAALLDRLRADDLAGRPLDLRLFWGHKWTTESASNPTAWLSQWYPAPFAFAGITYQTAEHWMMAEKARLFGDHESLSEILRADGPAAAKALGRKVQGYDDGKWAAHRYAAVVVGNLAKFQTHAALQHFLLSTGERVLAEASPYDRIWGIGLSANHPDAARPSRWRGLNLLGFALMEVRRQLAWPRAGASLRDATPAEVAAKLRTLYTPSDLAAIMAALTTEE